MAAEQPISISITVGALSDDFQLVADPTDVMFALQVGRTVSEIVMALGRDVT
jgi:hypothetical protein